MNRASASIAGAAWFSDPALRRVFELLNGGSGEVRIVGGAIRNTLMGLEAGDIDLATTWTPEEVVARAEKAGIRAVPTGIEHGTVTLVVDGRAFEVTTLRHDVATDGRRAEVAFGADWEADARRRDFTMNALYADAAGQISDPTGGLQDIETRTVRFIGSAAERIAEDYLRILRYFRFYAHYGDGRPDAEAIRACARAKDGLSRLSAERIWKELKLLFAARDPGRALLWMRQAGILTVVLPETEKWGIDAISGLISAEQELGWVVDPELRLMAVVPPDAPRLEVMADRLRLSRAEKARLVSWAGLVDIGPTLAETAFNRLLYRSGTQPVRDRLRLSLAAARARTRASDLADDMKDAAGYWKLLALTMKWVRPEFPLSGKDLIAAGEAPGPGLGEKLLAAENRWIDSNFTLDKQSLLGLALSWPEG